MSIFGLSSHLKQADISQFLHFSHSCKLHRGDANYNHLFIVCAIQPMVYENIQADHEHSKNLC